MANEVPYLDYQGLGIYDEEIKGLISQKVDKVTGKQLTDENFTTAEKTKLSGLENYTLPATKTDALGGVIVATTNDPVPEKTALKTDPNGKAFVDWTEAPAASQTSPGMVKLGTGLKVNAETGATEIDPDTAPAHDVNWIDIQGKPDLALKSDLTSLYRWKGSVATINDLPTTDVEIGWVYDVVEEGGMNYGWTGTGWDPLGQLFRITPISAEQIRALFATGGDTPATGGEEVTS